MIAYDPDLTIPGAYVSALVVLVPNHLIFHFVQLSFMFAFYLHALREKYKSHELFVLKLVKHSSFVLYFILVIKSAFRAVGDNKQISS